MSAPFLATLSNQPTPRAGAEAPSDSIPSDQRLDECIHLLTAEQQLFVVAANQRGVHTLGELVADLKHTVEMVQSILAVITSVQQKNLPANPEPQPHSNHPTPIPTPVLSGRMSAPLPPSLEASPRLPAMPMPLKTLPGVSADGASKRVMVWNRAAKRKISGMAAPMEKNLEQYLRQHPECEIYNGQGERLNPVEKAEIIAREKRIQIWNKAERRRVSGKAAPCEKNLAEYLRKHPECEVYNGQDKKGNQPLVEGLDVADVQAAAVTEQQSITTAFSGGGKLNLLAIASMWDAEEQKLTSPKAQAQPEDDASDAPGGIMPGALNKAAISPEEITSMQVESDGHSSSEDTLSVEVAKKARYV